MTTPAVPAEEQGHPRNQGQQSLRPPSHIRNNPRQSSVSNPAAATTAAATTTATSSDDDENMTQSHNAAEDEAGDMVGVSMSRAQTRMKARSTPAEEKNRIMEDNGGYFETIPDMVHSDGLYLSDVPDRTDPEATKVFPGTPDRKDLLLKEQQLQKQEKKDIAADHGREDIYSDDTRPSKDRSSFTRSILNGLPKRPRALSGDAIANLSLKKFLPDIGSLARRSSLPFRMNNSPNSNQSLHQQNMRSQTMPKPPPTSNISSERRLVDIPDLSGLPRRKSMSQADNAADATDEPISELQSLGGSAGAKHSFSRRPSGTGAGGAPPLLRRTSSDHSLYLRASSTASSLDHRPQFENVHSQVNSRFKAIKDSLQDSSSRLLSMPTFNLHDIRTDWGYKPFFNDVSQRKANDGTDAESSSSQDEPPKQQTPRPNPTSVTHPILTEAMDELTGDVVIMGGYRGSILRSAKPPHRQLWVPMKVGLNLRKVDLEVGLTPEDEENMEEHVIPSGVLSHVGPVDICRRLMKRLQTCDNAVNGDLRVWDYGYDWRLNPHLLSKRLIEYLEGLPCNAPDVPREKRGAYVVAHSLGGLIIRHAVNQRPELFAGVIYAGVPQHCVNILGPLRNGDDVLLSSRVLTAQVNFSFRTSFVLLPEDGHCFIDKQTKEEYPVDFFSPEAWDEYRFSPCIKTVLPPVTGRTFMETLPLLGKKLSTLGNDESEPTSGIIKSETSPATFDPKEQHETGHRQHTTSGKDFTAHQPLHDFHAKPTSMKPPMGGLVGPTAHPRGASAYPKTAATANIPYDKAMDYLRHTLSDVYHFKQELSFNPTHQKENRYPPFAVVFGKSVPTVYGARVWSREHIKHQDAYDDLAFAAGDGVCLASAAMLPHGYRIIKDGLVKSDRGHVGLLGDLEAIGQSLKALIRGRREGVGWGSDTASIRGDGKQNHGLGLDLQPSAADPEPGPESLSNLYVDPSPPAEEHPTHATHAVSQRPEFEHGHRHGDSTEFASLST